MNTESEYAYFQDLHIDIFSQSAKDPADIISGNFNYFHSELARDLNECAESINFDVNITRDFDDLIFQTPNSETECSNLLNSCDPTSEFLNDIQNNSRDFLQENDFSVILFF